MVSMLKSKAVARVIYLIIKKDTFAEDIARTLKLASSSTYELIQKAINAKLIVPKDDNKLQHNIRIYQINWDTLESLFIARLEKKLSAWRSRMDQYKLRQSINTEQETKQFADFKLRLQKTGVLSASLKGLFYRFSKIEDIHDMNLEKFFDEYMNLLADGEYIDFLKKNKWKREMVELAELCATIRVDPRLYAAYHFPYSAEDKKQIKKIRKQ